MDGQLVGLADTDVATAAWKQLEKAGGGALCVYHRGEKVLDLWAGERDPDAGLPWEADTTAMAWSTTKGVASTALHMALERNGVDVDTRVIELWPEFGAEGKEATTVRHVLTMEAGLYDIRHLIDDPRHMLDDRLMAELLAAAAPAHPPGAANGYHALTYGWLVGELVRRLTGASLGGFVRTEIAEPLGLDSFHIGTPADRLDRVAAFPELPSEPKALRRVAKAVNPLMTSLGFSPARFAAAMLPRGGDEVIPTDEFLMAEVGSANGVFTARSLARFYAALGSEDGLDGVRLWSPERRRVVAEVQNRRRDLVLGMRMRWRLGYHQPVPRRHVGDDAFGFYGAYGSGAFTDPSRQLAVGVVVQASRTGGPFLRLMRHISRAIDARSAT